MENLEQLFKDLQLIINELKTLKANYHKDRKPRNTKLWRISNLLLLIRLARRSWSLESRGQILVDEIEIIQQKVRARNNYHYASISVKYAGVVEEFEKL